MSGDALLVAPAVLLFLALNGWQTAAQVRFLRARRESGDAPSVKALQLEFERRRGITLTVLAVFLALLLLAAVLRG